MTGISPDLYSQTREVIAASISEHQLRYLFTVDPRLTLWADHIPSSQGLSNLEQAEALIGFLLEQANHRNENGLLLLLKVLGDNIDQADMLHHNLKQLSARLESFLTTIESVQQSSSPHLNQYTLCLGELRITLWSGNYDWMLQAENVGETAVNKATIYLHPGQKIWVNQNRIRLGTLLPQTKSQPITLQISIESNTTKPGCQLGLELIYKSLATKQPMRYQDQIFLVA